MDRAVMGSVVVATGADADDAGDHHEPQADCGQQLDAGSEQRPWTAATRSRVWPGHWCTPDVGERPGRLWPGRPPGRTTVLAGGESESVVGMKVLGSRVVLWAGRRPA